MEDFASPDFVSSAAPLANIQIQASEYYRAWAACAELPDIEVAFYIMHGRWNPEQRTLFDNMVGTKSYLLGRQLAFANHLFDFKYVKNNSFISREPLDVSKTYELIKEQLQRFNDVPVVQTLSINGVDYTCYGKDNSSARLLYSILTLAVSDAQVEHLKQDVLSNGNLSRILFNQQFEGIFAEADFPICRQICYLADFFKTCFNDQFLRYAAALLVCEHQITPELMALFVDNRSDELQELAIQELDIEAVKPLAGGDNAVIDAYFGDGVWKDPWVNVPHYDRAVKPLASGQPLDVAANNLMLKFDEQLQELTTEPKLMIGQTINAAGKDFSHDYCYRQIEDYCTRYFTKTRNKAPVFIVGSNMKTPFQTLGMSIGRLHVCRASGGFFDIVRRDQVDAVVYTDGVSYLAAVREECRAGAFVIDTVSYRAVETSVGKSTRVDVCPYEGSADAAARLLNQLLGKPSSIDPLAYHKSLPAIIALRFSPSFMGGNGAMKTSLARLMHHYDVRFLPPRDLFGHEFCVYMHKRVAMLPKLVHGFRHPWALFKRFYMHTMVIRYILLDQIKGLRYSWKCIAPLRMLSRYYGVGSKLKFDLHGLIDFRDWGSDRELHDYNTIFSGYVNPEVFNKQHVPLYRNKSERKVPKRDPSSIGVSILTKKNKIAAAYLNGKRFESYGPAPTLVTKTKRSPMHVREKAAAKANAFPV